MNDKQKNFLMFGMGMLFYILFFSFMRFVVNADFFIMAIGLIFVIFIVEGYFKYILFEPIEKLFNRVEVKILAEKMFNDWVSKYKKNKTEVKK